MTKSISSGRTRCATKVCPRAARPTVWGLEYCITAWDDCFAGICVFEELSNERSHAFGVLVSVVLLTTGRFATEAEENAPSAIKAFCIDFNWGRTELNLTCALEGKKNESLKSRAERVIR